MNSPISKDALQAYADGQLDAASTMQVETWLATHPEHRKQVEEWRAQCAQLHRTYDRVLDEPIPSRLLPAANSSSWLASRKFASVFFLFFGSGIGYLLHDAFPSKSMVSIAAVSLPHMAAVAHAVYVPESRHPVEVGADQQLHLVAWLSKRLGAELNPPILDAAGYQLVGGRLLPGDKGEVAQFMYESANSNRLTLYIRPDTSKAGNTSFRYASENNIDVFYWMDEGFGYALSGDIGREQMLKVAKLVYEELEKPVTRALNPKNAKPQSSVL